MSLFNKLFGGGKKEEKQPPPPPVPTKVNKQIQAESAIAKLSQQISKMDDDTNKYDYQAQIKTEKAKELMAANKKKQAKIVVAQLAEIKKKIENINIRKKVLRTQKTQLEAAMMDMQTLEHMEFATQILKGNEDMNDRFNEIILDTRQIQMNQEETNRLMKQIAGGDQLQQEADDLFKQLQAQVESKNAERIQQAIGKPKIVNPVYVSSTTAATNKSSSLQDDISKYLQS